MFPNPFIDQQKEDLHLRAGREDESKREIRCVETSDQNPKDQESVNDDLSEEDDEPEVASRRVKSWPFHLLAGIVIVLCVWLNLPLALLMLGRSDEECILMLVLFLAVPSIFYIAMNQTLVRRR